MAITLSTGAQVFVAKTYAAPVSFVGANISNIAEAVVTIAHTLAQGDYVEVSSGWGLIDKQVYRVKSVSTTVSFVLENCNTADTNKFTAGAGGGSFRKISLWSELTQVKSVSASGGSQNFANITAITDTVERQIPTTKAAVSMTVDCYDDPSLPWYSDVVAADQARSPYGLKMQFPNGSKLVANAYWSLQKVPTMATNDALMTQISLSYAAEPVRYAT